jgi:hypothetical protein
MRKLHDNPMFHWVYEDVFSCVSKTIEERQASERIVQMTNKARTLMKKQLVTVLETVANTPRTPVLYSPRYP